MRSINNDFQAEIPNLLIDLDKSLKGSVNCKAVELNFDLNSLNLVESYYLDIHDEKEQTNLTLERLKLCFYAYVGEVFLGENFHF